MKTITKQIGSEVYSYNVYKRKKKNGKFREITAPDPLLKSLQHAYALAFFEKVKDEFSAEVTGFMPGVSIKDNARRHIGKEWVVNLDIKSFFPSTTKEHVKWALEQSKLDGDQELALEVLTLNDALPQGSPASPVIANYVGVHLIDPEVKFVANSYLKEFEYSRYADDLTLSFNEKLDVKTIKEMIRDIANAIKYPHGFEIAEDKISMRTKNRRQAVTGITVNAGFSINRQEYLRLRACTHQVRIGKKELDNKLKGKLNYVKDINPTMFDKLTKGLVL
jgi:retron-type reverse transcriptase